MDKKIDNNILFSIIIPVYNVQAYIRDCIESILKQKCRDYEIILVDDGSTDESGKLCDEYAYKYQKIQVIHQSNQGLSGARNTGIQNAKGKYLIYLDSDDMMAQNALSNLSKVIYEQNEPSIIISRRLTYESIKNITTECRYYFDTTELSKLNIAHAYSAIQALPDMWMGAWIFTTKRTYILEKKFYFYPSIFHEDEEWVPKIFLNADTIGYNNNCIYINRVDRVGSITSTLNIKREFDKLMIIELLRDEFTVNKYSIEICEVVAERVRSIYFGVLCEMKVYAKDKQFLQLEKQMKEKRKIMRNAKKKSHKLANVLIILLGVRRAGDVFGKIKSNGRYWFCNKKT